MKRPRPRMQRVGRDGWVTLTVGDGAPRALPPGARLRSAGILCPAQCPGHLYLCTRPAGHGGRHRADAGRYIAAVWR